MEFVIFWFICGLIAAAIGSSKGEGCVGFIIGLILGPLGILAALLSKGNRVRCPYCREYIDKKATKCPKCQSDLNE